jgi:tetratricopeptide (TPR) repeat protein
MEQNISGGVNVNADTVNAQDVVGRDKVTNIIVADDAQQLLQQMSLQQQKQPQPLRVLAVIAAPIAGLHDNDRPPVSLSGRAEWAKLRDASKVAPMLLARLRPPTETQLHAVCSPNVKQFNIVHFICHGLPEKLALEDDRGLMKLVFTQSLYRELAAGRSLRVAFDQAVKETTAQFEAEKGNAIIEGDDQLKFPRPDGEVLASQVFEGSSLPDESARFFGRRKELLMIADALNNADLRGVALTGIGGMGKSALAFEAGDRNAWRFQNGVTYVRAPETGMMAKDALAEFVASLNMDAGSKVLFTLRPPLSDHFKDVREINLTNGLDEDSAIEYARFIARNENAAPQWQNLDEAKALVDRVKGHPELIRLTVNRSKKIPFAQVKSELAPLSGKLDEALQEMIGKQVHDAGDLAQTALLRLTIFPQPRMIAEAATAACGDAVAGLEALVDHGVIAFEQDEVQRYALHPTVIDWVKRHGAGEKETSLQEARQRTVAKYVDFVKANWRNNDLLAEEHDNLIASLDWAWADQMWSDVSDLAWYIDEYLRLRGYWNLATMWMERGLEATRKMPESNERQDRLGKLLHTQAGFKAGLGDLNGAMALFQQSLDLKERLGDLQGKARTLHQMALVSEVRDDLNGAMQLYQQSLDTFEWLGELQGKAATLSEMANIKMQQDEWSKAASLLKHSIDIAEQLHDLYWLGLNTAKIGQIAEHNMNLAEAAKLYRESIGYFEQLGSPVAEQVKGMLAKVEQMMKGG